MGRTCLFWPSLVLGLVLLAMAAVAGPTSAQELAKIEVVPNIPHSEVVSSVAFSPDGTRMLSGSEDATIRLWDAATGSLLRIFNQPLGRNAISANRVESVAFSPDGARVLSGSLDNMVRLWNAATGALLRTFEGHSDAVWSVASSPDGTRILSGSVDKTIKLWDADMGALLRTFEGHSDAVTSVAFSPDAARILSGSEDRTIRLWDAATGALLRSFDGHADAVTSVAFSRDGTRLLSGSADKTIRLWNTATGALLRSFKGHAAGVTWAAFSPDGTGVLSASHDDTVRLWDAATGAILRTSEGFVFHSNSVVAISPDGSRALSGGNDYRMRLWEVATAKLVRDFRYPGWIRSVTFSRNGARVLWHDLYTIKVWDAATGTLLRTFEGHSGNANSAALSPDGARLLTGREDGTVGLWDAATGGLLRTFDGHSDSVWSVAFSPDGTRVLSGGADKTVRFWDAATGTLLRTFEGHTDLITSVLFSPDGTRVLSGSTDNTIRLWDTATGAPLLTIDADFSNVHSVVYSPEGAQILTGGNGAKINLWDAATGALLRTFRERAHPDWVNAVAFSPEGARIVTGGSDRTLRLWDAATGAPLHSFEGHLNQVHSVAYSFDGSRIVSGGKDNTARIWDAASGAQIATLMAGQGDRWLALTTSGFFAGSRSANDVLAIVRGLDATTIDQVHQSLFNPDLVREALAGDPDGEVAEAAKVINLEKVLDSGPAPSVAFASPAGGSQHGIDVVSATVRIVDRGQGVGRIEWRVNGITAAVAAKPKGSGPTYTVARQLALDQGDNVIEVVAYNGSNLLASLPARTSVKFTGPADKTKPKLHILAVGINAYVDKGWTPPGKQLLSFGPLDLAVKDATVFADRMKKATAGLYDEVRVSLALDRDATRDNLQKLINKVAAQIHPRDSFILFAAAHGHAENGRFCLIPQDYQSGPPGTLARRAIGQNDLQDWLANRIKARKAIVLLDTCESGSLIAGHRRSRTDTPASEAAIGRLHEATGRPVLTATAAGQLAGEGPIAGSREGHGYFTWAVLDALHHGDTNGNGLIELTELAAHVQSVLPKVAAGIVVRAATPEPDSHAQAARFGSRGEDFPIARRLQ